MNESALRAFFFFRFHVQTMIFSGIIFILCWLPSEMNSSDDSFEILSVNTGEIATFLCDLPERYSNQPVSSSSSSHNTHLFPFQAEFYAPGGRLLGRKSGENLPRRYTLEHTYVLHRMTQIDHNLSFSYAWTWSLIISDVSDDDAGEYTCRVLNSNRTLTIIKRFNLTVLSESAFSFGLICDHQQISEMVIL